MFVAFRALGRTIAQKLRGEKTLLLTAENSGLEKEKIGAELHAPVTAAMVCKLMEGFNGRRSFSMAHGSSPPGLGSSCLTCSTLEMYVHHKQQMA